MVGGGGDGGGKWEIIFRFETTTMEKKIHGRNLAIRHRPQPLSLFDASVCVASFVKELERHCCVESRK